MRVLLSTTHRYPAGGKQGTGMQCNPRADGGSCIVHDLLAKGLAEIGGIEVFYDVEGGDEGTLPPGVTAVSGPMDSVDILHHYNSRFADEAESVRRAGSRGQPWLTTCHEDPRSWGVTPDAVPDNWIPVSRTLSESLGGRRYVRNGIDPSEFSFSETKDDYFLFICHLGRAHEKGLDTALALSHRIGFELVVAGTSNEPGPIIECAELCRERGARFTGDVRGQRKAELLAGARALLFPTALNEAFGLVMIEALVSGTPVIASNRGACPEIVSADVGFVCNDMDDYVSAVNRIGEISSLACRQRALNEFHYLQMTAGYIREYEAEIGS